MSYRDRLQTGSFRNVPFFIEAHTLDGGRRAVLHEFPERDDPYTEDLGRRGRSYAIDCHIIGEDYFGHRDALIRALERSGPGVLIHPYLGRKDVQVTNFSLTESITEGRICKFSITFLERGRILNPFGFFSSVFAVFDQVNQVIADVRSDFETLVEFASFPSFVVDSFTSIAFETVDMFNEAIGIVPATLSELTGVQDQIFDMGNQITDIFSTASTDDTVPGQIFDAFTDTQQDMTTITPNHSEKQQILDYVIANNTTDQFLTDTTPSRAQEKQNTETFFRAIESVAIVQKITWLTQSVTRPFDLSIPEMVNLKNDDVFSITDLQTKRDEIVDLMDRHLLNYPDVQSRQSLLSLQAKFISAIDDAQNSLKIKKKFNFTTNKTYPALALIYDKTEQIKFEDDFVARNKIRHPAHVSGGEDYEVIEF